MQQPILPLETKLFDAQIISDYNFEYFPADTEFILLREVLHSLM